MELCKRNQDERPPWSDSLSPARALVMWKGRVLMVVRRSGEPLERRAVLVKRDIVRIESKNLFSYGIPMG